MDRFVEVLHISSLNEIDIRSGRERLVREVRENDTVVILGETGSGKTTRMFRIPPSTAASKLMSDPRGTPIPS